MMQVIRRAARGTAVALVAVALGACDDEIPTATGSDLFPGGVSPMTLIAEFTGSDLVLREEVHEGFGNPRLTPFLIVANDFEGALDAHAIARFAELPDSVVYTIDDGSRRSEVASYPSGRVLVRVDSVASFPRATTRLQLWELTQAWDSATVTWEYARNRPGEQVPWTTPGGAIGALLAEEFWIPGDTAAKDTVVWELDSLAVNRLRSEDHPGVIVTTNHEGSRLKLSGLIFAGDARPATDPDTLVEARAPMTAAQTFIYSPEIPESEGVLATGGLRGDRTILTLDLEQEVEACPEGGGACTLLPLSEVTLNRAQLVLKPVPVAGGHRPIARPRVQLRRVAEPELGRFAPLGAVVASDTITSSAFAEGSDREFELDITATVLQFLAAQELAEEEGTEVETELSFALLTDFEVADLGLLWFERSPRLRVIYTLPLNPTLP